MAEHRFLRIGQVKEQTGLSVPTIYRLIAAGEFPRSIPLGPNAVGWLQSEVAAWAERRVAERDRRFSSGDNSPTETRPAA